MTEQRRFLLQVLADVRPEFVEASYVAHREWVAALHNGDEAKISKLRGSHLNVSMGLRLSALASQGLVERQWNPVLATWKYAISTVGIMALAEET